MATFLITFFLALMVIAMLFALGNPVDPLVTPLYESFVALSPLYMIVVICVILLIIVTCLFVLFKVALNQKSDKLNTSR